MSLIRIAFCDDNPEDLAAISTLLGHYRTRHSKIAECSGFLSALELVEQVRVGATYDLILLDVIMPGLTGIETALSIREYDQCVKIIFLTSSHEFGVESYLVNAYHYLLKPVQPDTLFALLDRALADLAHAQEDGFLVRCESTLVYLPVGRLEYCTSVGRNLHFYLADASVLKSCITFTELASLTQSFPQLLRPHRSFLVNMDHIFCITGSELCLRSGARIPIARAQRVAMKDEYLKYIFSKNPTLLGK